jgi:rare lipoprotein A
MHAMTAAHRTLPFQTIVQVHNLDNGKKVQVRVNDRGPFVKGRIVDLSRAAAQEIDMVGSGTARVRLEILRIEVVTESLAIQVGSFAQESRAHALKRKLEGDFAPVTISRFRNSRGLFHRVLAGNYPSRKKAREALDELRSKGLEGFVTRRD